MGYNITITAIAILITVAIIYFSLQHKNKLNTTNKTNSTNKTDTSDADNSSVAYAGMKPRELCKAILHDLNCKTEEDEEEGSDRLAFKFQGETFCIIVSDDCLLATIYDFSWGSVELDDIDEVSRVRKIINEINFQYGGHTLFYTMDTDNNRMVVHTKRQILLTPEIPNLENYMTAMLSGFFEVQRAMAHELDKERMKKKA